MSTITVNITKSNIYSICEGISISISQHNGGTPTYEQLWASADEAKKLDIYYREAISDLERHLTEWIKLSSAQFDLTEDGDDYDLSLSMSPYWPVRLQGLLSNKIQDYLVHAVTAGWLNDFDGLTTKQDYQSMAGQDVNDIRNIIEMREFNFTGSARTNDGTDKDEEGVPTSGARINDNDDKDDSSVPTAEQRNTDGTDKDDSSVPTAEQRNTDGTDKDDSSVPTAEQRNTDGTDKDDSSVPTAEQRTDDNTDKEEPGVPTAGTRQADKEKDGPLLAPEAGYRRKDNAIKFDNNETPPYCRPKNLRHRDNDVVDIQSDWTDWSGTGIAYRDGMRFDPDVPPHMQCHRGAPLPEAGCIVKQESCRVGHGQGYTPSRLEHRPNRPTPPTQPTIPTQPLKPNPKDPRIPDNLTHPNYPPFYANGIDWSDKALYDEEGSEHYINRECNT